MTTKRILAALPLTAIVALAACVPAPPQPTPAPAPAPAPAPPPAPPPPAPVPTASHWLDMPATPGDWSYSGGTAQFGQPGAQAMLTLRCDRAGGAIEIARAGQAAAQVPMIVRAEAQERSLTSAPAAGSAVAARIAANDPLLDAMAFSKGRFAVEIGGLPTIYVPSWPEVTRVIEDCR